MKSGYISTSRLAECFQFPHFCIFLQSSLTPFLAPSETPRTCCRQLWHWWSFCFTGKPIWQVLPCVCTEQRHLLTPDNRNIASEVVEAASTSFCDVMQYEMCGGIVLFCIKHAVCSTAHAADSHWNLYYLNLQLFHWKGVAVEPRNVRKEGSWWKEGLSLTGTSMASVGKEAALKQLT